MKGYESSEFEEQAAFVEYCDRMRIPVFAIPNGYNKTPASRVKAKREGLRAGVPDLFVPIPTKRRHGLFIEMKYGRNKTSQEQDAWIDLLNINGYAAVVCYSCDKAIEAVKRYRAGDL